MAASRIETKMTTSRPQETSSTRRLYEKATERLRLAEGLLACLTDARRECESQLTKLQKNDPVREVTGRSSIDEKISETRRMVDSLRRIVEELGQRLVLEPTPATV